MTDAIRRILIVDDNPTIHEDFRKILIAPAEGAASSEIDDLERAVFRTGRTRDIGVRFELDSAHQGDEALACVERACVTGRRYAMAFVDIRMPPGWDGLDTIERLWTVDPALQTVMCTAYSDYSWDEMVGRLGYTDRLLILKKPFDTIEVRQLAVAVTTKWTLARQVEKQIADLERAAQRAEDLAELRARFVAVVSHEFRTPLASIMAAGDALGRYADRMTAEERADRRTRIHREIRHMTRLLDDALSVSREGTGAFPYSPRPVDLAALCHEIVAQCETTRQTTAQLVVEANVDGAMPALDSTLIRQILGNLLSNAVKYSPRGGTVRLQVESDADHVRLRVHDQGIGISVAEQARLFEPYQRGSNVGAIGGLGLGLAICRKAVESHHGTITVASALGEGTTFEVTLPCAPPELPAAASEESTA